MAAALARVDAGEVQRAIARYLVPDNRTVVIVDPDQDAGEGDDDDEEGDA
jgi:predicted Zn-dependent peptidase